MYMVLMIEFSLSGLGMGVRSDLEKRLYTLR